MRFYITKESTESIKASFFPIKSLYIIDSKEVAKQFASVQNREYFEFLVNEEIKTKILYAVERKKNSTIIFINENLTEEIVDNIKSILAVKGKVKTYIFIDKENIPTDMYSHFDEIIFFPKHKRVRIVECEPIRNPLYYWVNQRKMPKLK